jgi:hypothetical protein
VPQLLGGLLLRLITKNIKALLKKNMIDFMTIYGDEAFFNILCATLYKKPMIARQR